MQVDDRKEKLLVHEESKETEEGEDSDGEVEEPPYRSLSPCGLKRYGTVSSLEKLDEDSDGNETGKEQEELPSGLFLYIQLPTFFIFFFLLCYLF